MIENIKGETKVIMSNHSHKKELPPSETALFCRQVAMILKSGIPLYDGIELMCKTYEDGEYAKDFQTIYEGVKNGGTLYEGVKAAGFFPDYMVNMVRVGESVGKLDDVLESLGNYYENVDKIRTSVKNAVVYPLELVVMMAIVVSILVIKVLPVFTEVFSSLGVGMTASSASVLNGGVIIGGIMLIFTAVLLILAVITALLWKFGGKERIVEIGKKLFKPVRRLVQKQSAQRFSSVISMVMESGYSLESALDLVPELLPDKQDAQMARQCKAVLESGEDFASAANSVGLYDPLHQRMLKVGVEAGQTGQVLGVIADIYEIEVEEGIQNLAAWIEPALVGVLTLAIGGILLSVMLPLIGIMSSIG